MTEAEFKQQALRRVQAAVAACAAAGLQVTAAPLFGTPLGSVAIIITGVLLDDGNIVLEMDGEQPKPVAL